MTIPRFTTSCILACTLAGSVAAQTAFTPGNIVVSRSVYAGTAASLAAAQPLPPVCPSTAVCGTAKSTDSGAYASTTSTNNVFNNNTIDGSFGITSPIFLDQVTPAGSLVNTLPIPATLVTTSFSSKSEVSLNLSADGTALTFMGYIAPPNTIDVSNSNTPYAYDPTNPAGGSYYRAVVQVGANGAIQVTPTNSYSGNNGRAAALANGLYYMVGNSNNGSGAPANIIATAGVQMATPGQSFATPPLQVGSFSIAQVTNPATGLPYPPDKAGKDDNFRGLTIFNNTLYATKGSGSNGINTVYQVGDKGSLPTLANAASAALTVLPGFPTTLAKSAANFPFGIFFANANTLYVADEGDGTTANAGSSKTAGIGKWVLTSGRWNLLYTMQAGLNLGQQYSVASYPASLNPATDGIRNLTGKVNGDGTVTLFGVTSTVSANGDQGADPNKLVAIADTVANTDPAKAGTFTTLRSANAGEVLRGVALTPVAGTNAAPSVPLILSAANPSSFAISPGSLATAGGVNLAPASATAPAGAPFPTQLGTTSVSIVDANGVATAAPLLLASGNQITFMVPSTVALGTAQVTVTNGTATQTANNVEIASTAPGVLTLNGSGLAGAYVVQVAAGGIQSVKQIYSANSDGAVIASPIALSSGASSYLVMFGSGIAAGGTALTTATINGVNATVLYAGPQGSEPGLDQVDLLIPSALAGKGNVNVQLTTEGIAANPAQITIQ